MNFKNLHNIEEPIIICNVWDVESARIAQKLNFDAIGTSSGAIATMLGYQDGEEISFDEVEYIVGRIMKSTQLPFSVDLEAGYSRRPHEIVENIKKLEQIGVVGINIEDSIVNGKREILSSDNFTRVLAEVCSGLSQQNINIFVNVRTDTFLLDVENKVAQTVERAKKYELAGADGLFVPCIEREEDIMVLIDRINLPLNVMCMPKLPEFGKLKSLGVQRISMGNFVYNKLSHLLEKELENIQQHNSFQNLFNWY